MAAAPLRELLTYSGFPAGIAASPLTSGHEGAALLRRGGRLPVIVFSHAAHDHRGENTVIVQELASHGYAVVTVDHTNDAFTQFPDGRVSVPSQDPRYGLTPGDFAADVRFVLDRVADLDAGRNPDAGHRTLPAGLRGALDLGRVGVFGSSKGGTAAARVMYDDPRVGAGLSLDGPMEMQPGFTADLYRPFMLVTADYTRATHPTIAALWSHLRGWRLDVRAAGAIHASCSDYQVLIPQLAEPAGMSEEDVRSWIGTLDPARGVRIQQAYPLAFFDRHLRRRGHLLDGPSPAYPEVTFEPLGSRSASCPDADGAEIQGGLLGDGELVASCGQAAPQLESVDAPLDGVALLVAVGVEGRQAAASATSV
jgi:predicted dienelactone hydrolase